MRLKDYPITMNSTPVPDPIKFDGIPNIIETVNQTEAGTDKIIITRLGKMTFDCEFNCSSMWARRFAMMSELNTITLSCYDLVSDTAAIRIVRMREFKAQLVKNSRLVEGTKGLYKVTFKLEEF